MQPAYSRAPQWLLRVTGEQAAGRPTLPSTHTSPHSPPCAPVRCQAKVLMHDVQLPAVSLSAAFQARPYSRAAWPCVAAHQRALRHQAPSKAHDFNFKHLIMYIYDCCVWPGRPVASAPDRRAADCQQGAGKSGPTRLQLQPRVHCIKSMTFVS